MTGGLYDHSVNPLNLDPARDWITRDEAAAIWGVTPDAFSSAVTKGHAPKPGGHIGSKPMWDEAAVREANAARPGRGNWGPREPEQTGGDSADQ